MSEAEDILDRIVSEAEDILDRIREEAPPSHEDAITGCLLVIAVALTEITGELKNIGWQLEQMEKEK